MGPETIGVSGTEFGRIGRTEANNGDRKSLERKRVNYTNGLLGGRGVRRSAFVVGVRGLPAVAVNAKANGQ